MAHFAHEKVQDISIIRFSFNEIGLQQREELKQELDSMAPDAGGSFIFNLSNIGFLSSLAIATMVFFAKKVRSGGGEVKLCSPSDGTKNVIEIIQLNKIFEIYATEREAIKSFEGE